MKRVFTLIIISLLCGCTTIKGIKNSQGTGLSKTYAQSYDVVYDATQKAIRHLEGFSVTEEDRAKGEIFALHDTSAGSSGERVAVFLRRIDDQKTKVEVVSKAIVLTQLFAPDWENQIIMLLDMQLEK